MKVNIYEAKTNLSKYVDMLEKGEEEQIIVTRFGKKVARIVLYKEDRKIQRVGAGDRMFDMSQFDPHFGDEEIIKEFGI